MKFWGYGFALVTEVMGAGMAGYYLGNLADQKWGTNPWGVISGIILFLVVSLIHVVKALERLQK